MKRTAILWIISIIFTLSLAVYQRITGPTKPVRGKINIDNTDVKYKLLRTEVSGVDAEVRIFTGNDSISGGVRYKRYKSHDEWIYQEMYFKEGFLTAVLPTQQAAGKVMYEVTLKHNNREYPLTEQPVILRYKGDVPHIYLLPHILFMFMALLLSVRSGMQALFLPDKKLLTYTVITFASLVLGGLLFGPFVQKYAFGAYWTGFPFGHDFTDNKTAAAFIFWLVALVMGILKNKNARWWVLAATIVLLATYLVPHSVLGSEIDYTAVNP